MSQKSEDLLTVLDAGSSKIRVLVAELHEGALRYRAHSVINAEGMRKGLISDLGPATRAFNLAFTGAGRTPRARRQQPGRNQPGQPFTRDYPRRCPRCCRPRPLRFLARGSRNPSPVTSTIHPRRAARNP